MERLKQSFRKLRKNSSQAFTLIELLIVIGILGVLAVTVLMTLNPAEAQRKARDVQRARDQSTLQSIIEQAVNDGLLFPDCDAAGEECASNMINGTTATTTTTQPCTADSNWLQSTDNAGAAIGLCNYAKSIPADPQNGRAGRCINGTSGASIACAMEYYANIQGLDYELAYKVESVSNRNKLTNDAGNSVFHVEQYTSLATFLGGAQDL